VPSDSLIVSYFSHVPLRSASARIENGWADVFGLWAMGKSGSDIINFSCRCRPPTMGMSLHASYLTSEKLATDPNSSGPHLCIPQIVGPPFGAQVILFLLEFSWRCAVCRFWTQGGGPSSAAGSLLICILKLHYKLSAVRS